MAQYLQLLGRSPGFARLWLSQVISLTGDWFNIIALNTLVARYTDGSGLAISVLMLARFVPPLVIGPFAGVLVDRFDRKTLLIWSNLLRAVVVLGFLVADSPQTVWLIYALTFLQFTLSAVFEPGQAAITPTLVRPQDLITANTLNSITWSVMLALGAIIGGLVSAAFGTQIALVIDALTFAVAAALVASIQLPAGASPTSTPAEHAHETGSLLEGLRYVLAHPSTAIVLMVKGGNSVGNIDTLATVYATQVFILGSDGNLSLGIIFSVFGVGAILGPLVLNRLHDGSIRQLRRMILIGFVFATTGWFFIGSAMTFPILLLGMGIRAMGGSANWTYSNVVIQQMVPDRYMGRVFSLDFAVFQLITVASTIVHGALVDALGAEHLPEIAFGTALVSLVPLFIWLLAMGRIRVVEPSQAASAAD